MHPHSGIATLTYMIEGEMVYEDTTGKSGILPNGGVEWMSAGNGVWHDAQPVSDAPITGFQLWIALPAAQENGPAHSVYLAASQVARQGPAQVLLGRYGAAQSSIPAPQGMNYLAVKLKDGEHWRYTPPAGHSVAWLAINAGHLDAGGPISAGELAIFEESDRPIDFVAKGDTHFVLGSAVKHPHDLVTGYYSVHTSKAALNQGELEIERIGAEAARARQALMSSRLLFKTGYVLIWTAAHWNRYLSPGGSASPGRICTIQNAATCPRRSGLLSTSP